MVLAVWQVENTAKLIDEDNTIPFIARYRKELTGSLDDQLLRELYDRLLYLRSLEERRGQVFTLISEQGKMTDEIANSLSAATTLAEIDDIYRPFRPKRRTRATIAVERGLTPLADIIWEQSLDMSLEEAALPFVDPEKEVNTVSEAISGACDILAERVSDDPEYRGLVRTLTTEEGFIVSKQAVKNDSESALYEMYHDFSEPVKTMAGHRVLAVNRGEKEEKLKVIVEPPLERIMAELHNRIVKSNPHTKPVMTAMLEDSYKRLIGPSIEREIRNMLTERSEEGAIKVFAENLRQLLLQPPVRGRVVLALDPGYRTGCKVAVVDDTGKVLETGVVYCTIGKDTEPSKKTLRSMIERHGVDLIAIGNGTASRETERVVAELIHEIEKTQAEEKRGKKKSAKQQTGLQYVIVNEAGASVYSASKLGAEEFPDFDVALRSAVSIGRRLQDPLAELVKIDPKSIGVGQYQHDMNQKRLGETLGGVVEYCVNAVGVDLNTASPSLLSHVAGITGSVAKSILLYREENGKFKNRTELLKVKKLGPKVFLQCAGFLRIPGAANPLDNTGVHPESYKAAELMLKHLGVRDIDAKTGGKKRFGTWSMDDLALLAKEINTQTEGSDGFIIGAPTLADIMTELEKPGRDMRDELPPVLLRSDVLDLEDLSPEMVLTGTVRNIVDFGVFVDIGVHQDGLVHISQVADKYIKHPLDVVSVGDIVKVRVLSVDPIKKRIALSMKDY